MRHAEPCLLRLPVRGPALAQPPAPQKAAGGTLTIDLVAMQKPWTGDLDGMIERRVIRVLTVNSKTSYFLDKGVQRGIAVDYLRMFENELNKKLAADKKLKDKNLKVRVVFIPVRRDQLLPALAAGKGDIAAANLTITPERQKLVDFSGAGLSNVERGRGVGAGFTESRQPGRSLRQGRLRAQVVELLREPRRAQQEVCGRERNRRSRSRKPRRRWRTRICSRCSTPASFRSPSLTSTLRTSGSRSSRSSSCTTTSRFAPAARSRGRSAKAARSSRRRWTISPRATRSGPRPATSS